MLISQLALLFINIFVSGQITRSTAKIADDFARGEQLRLQGNFDAALPFFLNGLESSKRQNLPLEEIRFLLKIGLLNWNIGRVSEAAEQYSAARAAAKRIDRKNEAGQAEKALALIALYKQGKKFRDETRDYQQSIIIFDEAIRIANEIGSSDLKLKCIRQKSVVYYYKNDLINYYRLNTEALTLAEQTKNTRDLGVCLNNIGIYYLRIGEYALALRDAEQALDIARIYKNPQNIADALNTISVSLFGSWRI